MPALFKNNAFSTLASGITDVATSLSVAAADGALFPNPSGADYFYCTLIDTSNNLEIVKCTSRATDVLTIVRGQEGTANIAFSADDRVELRITAAGLLELGNWTKGSDIIAANALPVTTDADYWDVTGNTAITSIDSVGGSGKVIKLHFDGTPTITHHATDLILLGGANIVAAAGDEAEFVEYQTGDWRMTNYTQAGARNYQDRILQRPELKDYAETHNAIGGTGGGTQDIDLELGNTVSATVDTSTNTFTFSNPPASAKGGSFTLILTNGGSQTVNWPASVDWAGGTAPTLTTAGVDILVFVTVDGGTIWHGMVASADSK